MKSGIFKNHSRADDIVPWYTAYTPSTRPWVQPPALEEEVEEQQEIPYRLLYVFADRVKLKMLSEYPAVVLPRFIPVFLKQHNLGVICLTEEVPPTSCEIELFPL